ncbi:Cutinase gene palindrome-binding protein [Metarhizium anisopliae BRIP 53293]|uniref:Cutinase gene palindrome-binding protein n=1 Tax=Metarhizium anisopliae BRIP 53293 TaxID=1291518 RepID=A0A0D9NPA7_METAN|nr:Cutinase gene palindrome-binding protein [Metarhizium anisopliae BRIP 53293]
MSHDPPPPPPPSGNFYGFSPFNLNDLNNAQNSPFPAGGPSNHDLMSFFDDADMMDPFGDVSMNIDSGNGAQVMPVPSSMPANTNEDVAMMNDADAQASSSNVAQPQDDPLAMAVEKVPGAGPLPPRTFAQMSLNGGGSSGSASTLTDFTKRRNWPAKVVEELKDFLHILDANGRIKYASGSIFGISGYTAAEVQDVFLKDLIHPDDQGVFVAELNESIASGSPLRMFYRFKTKSGNYTVLETVGHAHIAAARFAPNPNNQSPFCQAVFMMSRTYPTKNAGLLDSFLEHKMENERLRRRISELRREEEAETEESNRQWVQSQEGRSDMTPSETTGTSTPFFRNASSTSDMQADGSALTRENLEGVAAGRNSDSLGDKMARYEGSTHAETIELLTGLRYLEGERSRGITTGGSSPTLIRGDAGIAIPIDRDARAGEKKKKLKTAEEYVCTDCGTLDSPEWRKGPNGPKTLCNACGLRWAKKEKKKTNASQKGAVADQMMG